MCLGPHSCPPSGGSGCKEGVNARHWRRCAPLVAGHRSRAAPQLPRPGQGNANTEPRRRRRLEYLIIKQAIRQKHELPGRAALRNR